MAIVVDVLDDKVDVAVGPVGSSDTAAEDVELEGATAVRLISYNRCELAKVIAGVHFCCNLAYNRRKASGTGCACRGHAGMQGSGRLPQTGAGLSALFPKEIKVCVATLTPLVLVRIQVPQPIS